MIDRKKTTERHLLRPFILGLQALIASENSIRISAESGPGTDLLLSSRRFEPRHNLFSKVRAFESILCRGLKFQRESNKPIPGPMLRKLTIRFATGPVVHSFMNADTL